MLVAYRLVGPSALETYYTQDHQIGGFSQQQSGLGSPSFVSQLEPVDVGRLPVVSDADEDRALSEPIHKPAAESNAAASHSEIFGRETFSLRSSAWAN